MSGPRKHGLALAGLVAVMAVACATATEAGTLDRWGPRMGLSLDPDQFVVGGQLVISDVAKNLTLDPSGEIGFGDNATVIALNLDAKFHGRVENSPWSPYAGFGFSAAFTSVDVPGNNDSDTELGGTVVVGASVPTRSGSEFFSELRLGLGDVPLMKLLVGWNFALK